MDIFVFWLICAGLAAAVASAKNRGVGSWLLLGLLFGIFALIIVALLPAIKKTTAEFAPQAEAITEWTHVRCPDCREQVRNDARKCKHCGAALVPKQET